MKIRRFLPALAFLVTSAWAALPDAVGLGVAVEAGNIAAARQWLDEGLDPNMEADRIGSGVMIGAWEGNIAMMELFASRGADLGKTNRFGEQALQLAAWRGHLAAVRWLVERGAPVNRSGSAWGALHYAVFAGQREVAQYLMARGADVNARAPNDATVLMMAAREGHEDLARALLDAGADPRLANDRGDTALTWAMRNGNFHLARLVASKDEFARAVKAPPQAFGTPKKSVPAPSEITTLLDKLRRAEDQGQPTAELRRALMEAIARFKRESTLVDLKSRKPAAAERPALVITARRGGGERAELVGETRKVSAGATPAQRGLVYEEASVGDFAELVVQLNRAEAEGRAGPELRRAVREALEKLRAGARPPPAPAPGRP